MKRRTLLQASPMLLGLSGASQAQSAYPSKPIRYIVPVAAGGGSDMVGRALCERWAKVLGQSVVVDNIGGGGGVIASQNTARAPADGYTLMQGYVATHGTAPATRKLPYDAEKDFTPIVRALGPLVIVVHPSSKIKTLQDLIDIGKREPNKLSFGSAGTGSTTYLGVRMLEEKTGAKFLHVPYKGVAPAYQDLLAGQIQFMMPDVASGLQLIKAGKIIPIVSEYKTPLIPNLPSLSDAGYPDVNTNTSFSLVAPSGTPSPIIEKLHKELMLISKTAAFASKVEAQGLIAETESLSGLSNSMKKERENYANFIKRNAIVASD